MVIGWRNLQGLIDTTLRDEGESSTGFDFDGLFRVATRITEIYGSWQGQDCTRAQAAFSTFRFRFPGVPPLDESAA